MDGYTDFDFEADRIGELAKQQAHSLDGNLHAQFYKHAELNSWKTREEGRKIFEEFVYIRILSPANRLNIIERRATPEDCARFSRQYQQFLKGNEQLAAGTPLDQLTSLTAAQILELKALHVSTVEQLAALADTTAQLMGTGGPELKRQAGIYLARASSGEALFSENQALKAQLAELVAKMAMINPEAPGAVGEVKTAVATAASK